MTGKSAIKWAKDNWLQLASIVAIPLLTIWLGIAAQNRQARQSDFALAVQIESEREKHGEVALKWAQDQIAKYTEGSQITLASLPPELRKRLCFAPRAELLVPLDYKTLGVVEEWSKVIEIFKDQGLVTGEWQAPLIAPLIIARYEELLSEIKAGCEAVQRAP